MLAYSGCSTPLAEEEAQRRLPEPTEPLPAAEVCHQGVTKIGVRRAGATRAHVSRVVVASDAARTGDCV